MKSLPVQTIELTLAEAIAVLKATPLSVVGQATALAGVATDSRQVQPGNLFFCLKGDRFDGHDFIPQAVAGGAAAVVVAADEELDRQVACTTSLLVVDDPLKALGDLASWWLAKTLPKVIAVTGSNGKTTTKEMIAAVLARQWNVHRNRGNFNNLIGVPLTIFDVHQGHQVVVLEMGMNRPGEIARLAAISRPHGVVLTNVAEAHLEGLGSLEAIARAKSEIFAGLREQGYIVYNADDPQVARIVAEAGREYARQWRLMPVTMKDAAGWSMRAIDIDSQEDGVCFVLESDECERQPIVLPLWGRHNIMNALLAAAVARVEGVSLEDVGRALEGMNSMAGRLCTHLLPSGRIVIDDTYNANPASMMASLETLNEMRGHRYAVAVLGDMFELGSAADQLHYQVGAFAARTKPDLLITYGTRSRELARAAMEEGMPPSAIASFVPGEEAALTALLQQRLVSDHIILVKGSRAMAMDKLVAQLLAEEGAGS
ncbi:MAG: UDP-N-acetylmuramoyl-tripeptide--D-alanyl-D-alanine ligase [Deltaproteobacteria bacterium]|nr:UDP-N-acetylmuramoyl-tripeptide--D-alanyl-D-alanine ligase [Candidatus Anaeroferrophillus wilburensis]MBN2888983.1 UDP-N-acetylmuramoyl-tripeptide--D-alanyl-D-alanine ligase [Deltaproteobacteria bacterium]